MTKLVSALAGLTITLASAQAFAGVVWMDTTAAMRAASGYPITSRGSVSWAYANRGAEAVCAQHGYARGLYTGAQSGELMGLHCFTSDMVTWQDVPFGNITRWAWWDDGITVLDDQMAFKAEAATTGEAGQMGLNYGAGFLTGHKNTATNHVGMVGIDRSRVGGRGVRTDATGFPDLTPSFNPHYAPWYTVRAVATQVCESYGFATGVASGAYTTGTIGILSLSFHCFN
ncbi:hypothetical protein MYSTI_06860 [Myxococcus stipitatus DSM 14675]|uniref:Lipoprotein n=1 Tax=Myxococcus stipitatus (strain DSM 14675 / JCM 12634 / Mx s8) TaxID=1278073 RepID=L7UJE5_MYXSD|nr:hypothetical protein [Myxococcus stipitatus]AGC48133.1 hypothetical protein MYSTI_06860 [Myxococcus stipitatus DSM 14675]